MKRLIPFLVLLCGPVFGSSQGPLAPTAASDNAAIGTVAWTTPTNVEKEDGNVSSTTLSDTNAYDYAVYLLKAGSVVGTNHLNGTAWPASLAFTTYGASTDTWGITWTNSDINDSNFGTVIAASSCVSAPTITHYLQANQFNFSIPGNTRIDGIVMEVKKDVFACLPGGGGASFVAGTKVSIPGGRVPIEDLMPGDVVWSFTDEPPHTFTPNVVDHTWSHRADYLLDLRTKGNRITTTPDHRFFNGSGYQQAYTLTPGSHAMTQTRYGMISNRVVKNIPIEKRADVYEFSLKNPPHNYIANGFGVHNPVVCAVGSCAGVDFMRMTVYYTILPQVGTNAGSGVIGTNSGAGTIKTQ